MKSSISILYTLGGALLANAQTIDLGAAISFGALAPAGVTSTGATDITGDVGTTGTSVTGFPPGVITGTFHVTDATATSAQSNFSAAYLQGQALTPTIDEGGLASISGLTLVPGIYKFDTTVTLDGSVTLSGAGTYVFQIGTALTVLSGASVVLAGGATACDVYWVVGSSATLGTNSAFVGNVLSGTEITVATGATVDGGLFGGSSISLDGNTILACG